MRAYYIRNKERIKEKQRAWYVLNRDRLRLKDREYKQKHKAHINVIRKKYPSYMKPRNRENENTKNRLRRLKYRTEVLAKYGARCVCCNETTAKFLTIDHINNDGHTYKAKSGRKLEGARLYRYLLQNNCPNNVQLMCFNCNVGKQLNGGTCPHKN